MKTTTRSFVLGTPRFDDARLSKLAREQGDEVAWKALLAKRGRHPAGEVSGDFAVAVIDPNGRSYLAVDRFAVRTLCCRVIEGRLHVDPRADVLAALPPAAPNDHQALFDYLYFHVVPAPRTIYQGVVRLPPGHQAVFDDGQLTIEPYWVPRFSPSTKPRFNDLAEEFRSLLRSAVNDQLDGGKPACFLSGGTDSSTIAGMACSVTGRSAASYSIGFDADGYDEMAYARIAAKCFGTEHHEYYVTPDDLVRSIPTMALHLDQPFGNSSVLPAYYCAKMAREDGATRILAGDGGDELFGGNARYAKQRMFGWYESLHAGTRASLVEPMLERTPLGRAPGFSKAKSYVEQAKVPLPDRMQMYNLLLRLGVDEVLTPAFLEGVSQQEPLAHQRATWSACEAHDPLNRMLAFDWRYTLGDADLPKVCAATSLADMAVGFPFLDQRLVDFSMRLPVNYKLRGLKLRWFFKEALRGFLPDEIIRKRKQGFGLPFGVWCLRHAGLRALSTDSLRSLGQRGIVQPKFIDSLLHVHLPTHPGYYGEMVWILMMLEQWFRRGASGLLSADHQGVGRQQVTQPAGES